MTLSEQQLEDIYEKVQRVYVDMGWVRQNIEKTTTLLEIQDGRVRKLEEQHAGLVGKLSMFVVLLTLMANAIYWLVSKLSGGRL